MAARWILHVRVRKEYFTLDSLELVGGVIRKDTSLSTESVLQELVSILRLVMLNLLKLMTPQFLIYL